MTPNKIILSIVLSLSVAANISYAADSVSPITMTQSTPRGVKTELLEQLKISDIHLPAGNKPLECRTLRYRTVDVKPGSYIRLHSHENRPALLGVIAGTSVIYPYGHDPITVKVGGVYKEYKNIHYARNGSQSERLTMTTFDLLDDGSPCKGITYPQNTPLLDRLEKAKDPFVVSAPTDGSGEKTNPIYKHKISDMHFPAGSASFGDRVLRIRKVTLSPAVTLPHQDYSNRPAYLMVLDGDLGIAMDGDTQVLKQASTADLVNRPDVLISNHSTTRPASYLVMELWDPSDTNPL